jgi:hypothetical protein
MRATRQALSDADRRFLVRIRIGVPPHGLGERIDQIGAWLDANCGADGWAMAADGLHGVLNDAIAIYLNDTTLAGAFVTRWCGGYKVESADGAFQIRENAPDPPPALRGCTRHREAVLPRSPRTCRKSTAEMRGPNRLAKTHKGPSGKFRKLLFSGEPRIPT